MLTTSFYNLFENELKQNVDIQHYHRILNSKDRYLFRKSYVEQRMEYIQKRITKGNAKILDLGCGYGTNSFMLGSVGHEVTGTTLEYYFDKIENRRQYWNKHFDTSNVQFKYENIFKSAYPDNSFDYILVQDTLHHIEPIADALKILKRILKPDGSIIVIEENGNNIFNGVKNFKLRGFKRIVKYYDEKLQETMLFGNENTRSFKKWKRIFEAAGFKIDDNSLEYIRLFLPKKYKTYSVEDIIEKEQNIWRKNKLLREYFFFGINFRARKTS
jgi:SAM-dependent methyltransferase